MPSGGARSADRSALGALLALAAALDAPASWPAEPTVVALAPEPPGAGALSLASALGLALCGEAVLTGSRCSAAPLDRPQPLSVPLAKARHKPNVARE